MCVQVVVAGSAEVVLVVVSVVLCCVWLVVLCFELAPCFVVKCRLASVLASLRRLVAKCRVCSVALRHIESLCSSMCCRPLARFQCAVLLCLGEKGV